MVALEFRPYDPNIDRDTVLEFLMETVALDSEEPADLEQQRGHYLPALERTLSRDPRCVSLALLDGRVAGFVDAFPMPVRPQTGFMRFLYVVPQARGTGLSDRILDFSDRLLREHGCDQVLLDVRKGNLRAVAFYRRHGWKVLEQREGGFLRMRREL